MLACAARAPGEGGDRGAQAPGALVQSAPDAASSRGHLVVTRGSGDPSPPRARTSPSQPGPRAGSRRTPWSAPASSPRAPAASWRSRRAAPSTRRSPTMNYTKRDREGNQQQWAARIARRCSPGERRHRRDVAAVLSRDVEPQLFSVLARKIRRLPPSVHRDARADAITRASLRSARPRPASPPSTTAASPVRQAEPECPGNFTCDLRANLCARDGIADTCICRLIRCARHRTPRSIAVTGRSPSDRQPPPDAQPAESATLRRALLRRTLLHLSPETRKALVLWLDPSNLPRQDDPVGRWPDRSGRGNDALALSPESLPRSRGDGLRAAARGRRRDADPAAIASLDFETSDFTVLRGRPRVRHATFVPVHEGNLRPDRTIRKGW